LVSKLDNDPHSCGYCKGKGSLSDGVWGHVLSPYDYQDLIDRGWRRSGKYIYKPQMDKTCCPQFTIRCDVENHHFSKSHKTTLYNMRKRLNQGEKDSGVKMKTTKSIADDPNNSRIIDLEQRKKEDLEGSEKARHKRQLRRITKGLPVHKGVLRDPPKHIEQRLEEGLKLRRKNETTFTLSGANDANALEIELVCIGSERDLETQDESHEVYKKYQVSIHKDDPDDVAKKQWKRFLLDNPFREKGKSDHSSGLKLGLYHCQYRLNDKLIAVGVLDFLSESISSVYFYYDAEYESLNLGTYSALVEIYLSRFYRFEWYYMGYYIHSCKKMRYKRNFRPSYLACPKSFEWLPITKSICDLLDKDSHSRLSDENIKDRRSFALPINLILNGVGPKVLYMRQVLSWQEYLLFVEKEASEEDDLKMVQRYCSLMGRDLSTSICLYRS